MAPKKKANTDIRMMMMAGGDIIISEVHSHGDTLTLATPAVVYTERSSHGPLGFILNAWLPGELMVHTNLTLPASRVASYLDALPELIEFYRAWAEQERDKLQLFKKDFTTQINAMKEYCRERHERTKQHKKRELFANPTTLPDTLIDMFEEDGSWGDSNTTH